MEFFTAASESEDFRGRSGPATTPIDVDITWSGSTLTVGRPVDFAGTFTLTVLATAAGDFTTTSFEVHVAESGQVRHHAIEQILDELDGLLASLN